MQLDKLLLIQFLPTFGFILALLLLAHLFRAKISPAATFAWLLAIVFVPYLGVPFYILFGGRKMKSMARMKTNMRDLHDVENSQVPRDADKIFPIRSGNDIEMIPTAVETFRKVMSLIESAQKSIYITTYEFGVHDTGKLILEALSKKANEGLEVCLILDALGCAKVSKGNLATYKKAGGKYAFFMPMMRLPFRGRANLRNHRKMMIVDRKHAIVGGMNLSKHYMGPAEDPHRWKDLAFIIEGKVIKDIFDIFVSDWEFSAKKKIEPWSNSPEDLTSQSGEFIQVLPSGPDVPVDYLQEAILEAIFSAKKRLWIVTPYFVPDEILMRSLKIAARRGVDVRLYVPKKSNHLLADLIARTYLRELRKSGVRILRYLPSMLHAKIVVVDETLAIVGSANMDLRSLYLNYEVAFMIYADHEIVRFARWIEELTGQCQENLKSANPFEDILEGMGRLLAPLM